MRVRLPDLEHQPIHIQDKQSIVLIGANGSGKTRMSVWIDGNNPDLNIHRISAQKSLNMPKAVSPSELDAAEEKLLYGATNENKDWLKTYGKKNNRWGNAPEIHMLNDFNALMEFLMTENYEKSIEYRENHKSGNAQFDNETRLEKIKTIWEQIITHRKLQICAGKIEVSNDSGNLPRYNGSEMSDGERAIFHFIAEAVCAAKDSLVIIDEPENHLHNSILVRLWDSIEAARPDCMFLYITHNLDFASTRLNSQVVWVKNMDEDNCWDYELLEEDHYNDELLMEILGDRQKILFVEGTPSKSTDRKLYPKLFPKHTVIPLEGCSTVIQATKAYNQIGELHYKEVWGIVDRDRRPEDEITSLARHRVVVPDVAEIENLFMLPEVIKVVAQKQSIENIDALISETQSKTFDFLRNHLDEQALLFTKQRCMNTVNQMCNKTATNVNEYANNLNSIVSEAKVEETFSTIRDELKKIADEEDYLGALKVINNKGLLNDSGLPAAFGWKKNYYIDYVLRLLGSSEQEARILADAIKQCIPL